MEAKVYNSNQNPVILNEKCNILLNKHCKRTDRAGLKGIKRKSYIRNKLCDDLSAFSDTGKLTKGANQLKKKAVKKCCKKLSNNVITREKCNNKSQSLSISKQIKSNTGKSYGNSSNSDDILVNEHNKNHQGRIFNESYSSIVLANTEMLSSDMFLSLFQLKRCKSVVSNKSCNMPNSNLSNDAKLDQINVRKSKRCIKRKITNEDNYFLRNPKLTSQIPITENVKRKEELMNSVCSNKEQIFDDNIVTNFKQIEAKQASPLSFNLANEPKNEDNKLQKKIIRTENIQGKQELMNNSCSGNKHFSDENIKKQASPHCFKTNLIEEPRNNNSKLTNKITRTENIQGKEELMNTSCLDNKHILDDNIVTNSKQVEAQEASSLYFKPNLVVEPRNRDSSDDEGVLSSEEINFEEELLNCTSNQEKSKLVERKKLRKERETLTPTERTLLKRLNIKIPWHVPICHCIETRVSSYPTKQQKEQFAGLQIKFAIGPYSKEEDTKIKDNWSKFCESHSLEENPKLFLTFLWENKSYLSKTQRINFVRYLAKDLEHRPLWSIYGRFQLLFSKMQKGNFSSKEDDIIMAFYKNSDFPNKNSALASVLNRTRSSIMSRYTKLKAEESKTKFNEELDQKLVDNLLKISGKNYIYELKDVDFTPKNFKDISSNIIIHFNKLRRRWEQVLKPGLFVNEFVFIQEIREKMINLLSNSSITDRREINWKELSNHFDNIPSSKLHKMFTDLLSTYVPEYQHKSFPDIMNCLKIAQQHMVNRKIKKFNYEHKRLIFQ